MSLTMAVVPHDDLVYVHARSADRRGGFVLQASEGTRFYSTLLDVVGRAGITHASHQRPDVVLDAWDEHDSLHEKSKRALRVRVENESRHIVMADTDHDGLRHALELLLALVYAALPASEAGSS